MTISIRQVTGNLTATKHGNCVDLFVKKCFVLKLPELCGARKICQLLQLALVGVKISV